MKIWHPDRFSADDERLRRKAEDKLREINEAFAHINSLLPQILRIPLLTSWM